MSFIPLPVDTYSGAVKTIDYEHSRIHYGEGFLVNGKHTVANGATSYFLLKNPAANYPHLRVIGLTTTAGPMDIYLFESPTTSADGSTVSRINYNRNSATVPSLEVFSGPTVSVDGTQLEYLLVTGTKHDAGSGMDGAQTEFILKASTNYLIKVTNNSGTSANYALKLFWYEV